MADPSQLALRWRAIKMTLSNTWLMSRLDVGLPIVDRTKSRIRNARNLARTGPITCARKAGGLVSNHAQNPLRPSVLQAGQERRLRWLQAAWTPKIVAIRRRR